jgi:hypothetical protein
VAGPVESTINNITHTNYYQSQSIAIIPKISTRFHTGLLLLKDLKTKHKSGMWIPQIRATYGKWWHVTATTNTQHTKFSVITQPAGVCDKN